MFMLSTLFTIYISQISQMIAVHFLGNAFSSTFLKRKCASSFRWSYLIHENGKGNNLKQKIVPPRDSSIANLKRQLF